MVRIMDDLISRQAAIDLFPNDILEWDTNGGYIAPHFARQMIEDLPSAQPEPQWIPVSERLPDFGVDVLVCNDEGVQVTAKRTEWSIDPNCWAINYCGYDYDSWDFMTNGAIVAWMPLPKPYKEIEE